MPERFLHAEESIDVGKMKELQLAKLKSQVERCYEKVPFYREKFNQEGLKPDHIKSLADITKIPFITKDDLRHFYPHGLLAVELEQVNHYHLTSGTTGTPVSIGYTSADWEYSSQLVARTLNCQGLRPGELLYQGYGYGLWAGGPISEAGAKAMGARVLPVGGGRTNSAVQWLRDFEVNALTVTPSFMVYLLETAKNNGLDPKTDWKSLRIGVYGAESWSFGLRKKIEDSMPQGFRAYNIYGMTEAGGPTVATNCPYSYEDGYMHLWADAYLVEIIDPESGQTLPPGEEGELVLTTLDREAAPMLRFRTRDLTSLKENQAGCHCGRVAHPLAKHITGRLDDILKVRGTMVVPSRVENIVCNIKGIGQAWQFVVDREEGKMDTFTIQMEVQPAIWENQVRKAEFADLVSQRVTDEIGLRVQVELVKAESLPRYDGKAVRVIDKRKYL
jgi:phenylacetate-CoA ligase